MYILSNPINLAVKIATIDESVWKKCVEDYFKLLQPYVYVYNVVQRCTEVLSYEGTFVRKYESTKVLPYLTRNRLGLRCTVRVHVHGRVHMYTYLRRYESTRAISRIILLNNLSLRVRVVLYPYSTTVLQILPS